MDKLISVIVPIYNVEKYLDRCIQSIVNQSYQNIEIILVDDGATDKSGIICDDWANRDSRIRVIHKENGGLSDARNAGIAIAKGEYLAFVDSDDYLHTKYLSFLWRGMRETDAEISECAYQRFSEEIAEKQEIYKSPSVYSNMEALGLLAGKKFVKHVVAWNKLYKRELFDEIQYAFGKLHEDEFTTYKLFYKAKKIAILENCLYNYYHNDNSITTKKITEKRLDGIDALIERYYFYQEKGLRGLSTKTAHQLFQLFADFSSKKKSEFKDYKSFKKLMKEKFLKTKKIFKKEKMGSWKRGWIFLAKINLSFLKRYNRATYYMERLKDKTHGNNKKSD